MDGVFATDHLFFDMEGSRRTARRQPDPYILLGAAGAVTQRAKLGTIVANASWPRQPRRLDDRRRPSA